MDAIHVLFFMDLVGEVLLYLSSFLKVFKAF